MTDQPTNSLNALHPEHFRRLIEGIREGEERDRARREAAEAERRQEEAARRASYAAAVQGAKKMFGIR